MHGHAHLTDRERWTLGRGSGRTGGTRANGNHHGDRGGHNPRFRPHPGRLPAVPARKTRYFPMPAPSQSRLGPFVAAAAARPARRPAAAGGRTALPPVLVVFTV